MRIIRPEHKLGIILGGIALIVAVSVPLALLVPGVPLYAVAALVLQTALVVVAARTFRGADEDPVAARPWWQLTAKPTASVVLAVLFAAQVVSLLVSGEVTPVIVVAAVVAGVTALAYLHSAARLTRVPATA